MKKNKGITLVALIVTIIILLILAGITIAQLTGSGLFENAKLAKEKSDNAQEKEDSILADYEDKLNQYVDGSRDTVTIDKEEYETLKSDVQTLKEQVASINDKDSRYHYKVYRDKTIPAASNGTNSTLAIDSITIEKDCIISVSAWMQISYLAGQEAQTACQIRIVRDGSDIAQQWSGNTSLRGGAEVVSRIFQCKKGDILKFGAWTWNTSAVTVPNAHLVYYEL